VIPPYHKAWRLFLLKASGIIDSKSRSGHILFADRRDFSGAATVSGYGLKID